MIVLLLAISMIATGAFLWADRLANGNESIVGDISAGTRAIAQSGTIARDKMLRYARGAGYGLAALVALVVAVYFIS